MTFCIKVKKNVVPSSLIEDEYWHVNGSVKPTFVIKDGQWELINGKKYKSKCQTEI